MKILWLCITICQ